MNDFCNFISFFYLINCGLVECCAYRVIKIITKLGVQFNHIKKNAWTFIIFFESEYINMYTNINTQMFNCLDT